MAGSYCQMLLLLVATTAATSSSSAAATTQKAVEHLQLLSRHSAAIISKTSVMYQGSKSTSNVSYAGFMCPGFVAAKGHLLSFAEGRLWDCGDFGHHDLVFRRSVDDGKTWEPLRTILDPNTLPGCNKTEACLPYSGGCQTGKGTICGGGCAVWDPTPVVDRVTGDVHVFFGRSTTSCRGGAQSAGYRTDLWVMTTSDLGGTWSAPRNVTDTCSTPYGGGVTGSEGHGIQLESGMLIVPLYNVPTAHGGQGTCTSIDHGKTWQHGGAAAPIEGEFSGPYEGEIVELFEKTANGGPRLMYDTRISAAAGGKICKGVKNCRVTYESDDLGLTWTNATGHPEMPDPSCKGGIVRWTAAGDTGKRALFAIGVDSTALRVKETIFASLDDGKTFPHKLQIDTSGGYSTINLNNANMLAAFYDYSPDGHVGSSTRPGGCSFNLAIVDPEILLNNTM